MIGGGSRAGRGEAGEVEPVAISLSRIQRPALLQVVRIVTKRCGSVGRKSSQMNGAGCVYEDAHGRGRERKGLNGEAPWCCQKNAET